jgi:hypothetical protein
MKVEYKKTGKHNGTAQLSTWEKEEEKDWTTSTTDYQIIIFRYNIHPIVTIIT